MEISPPYLLFIGDAKDSLSIKIANSIVHWRPDLAIGESAMDGCEVTTSIPRLSIENAVSLGAKTFVSGSSFAVPRIAALAARFQEENPEWRAKDIKQAVLNLAGPSPGDRTKRTRYGWIANPVLSGPVTQ